MSVMSIARWARLMYNMKRKVLRLTCLIKKEGDQYSSLCLELDVASCGKTGEEAFEGLKAAAETYLQDGR